MNKLIVVKWIKVKQGFYDNEMRVVYSTHERFSEGTRFDFGFFKVATSEGFTITSLPGENNE